jgi:long-chain acyl-CoA synthetase
VEQAALGLADLGLKRGGAVGIWGNTMPEWTVANLAAMSLGAHCAGIYQTNTADQALFILNDCKASVLFVDTYERLSDLLPYRDQMPNVKHFVVWSGEIEGASDEVMKLDDLYEKGAKRSKQNPGELEDFVSEVRKSDYAVLVYTSGTTGMPKGVILTHENCMSSVGAVQELGLYEDNDSMPAFLPLSHVAEYVCFLGRLVAGMTAYFSPDMTKVGEVIKEKSPSLIVAVPRVYEKVMQKILTSVDQAPPRKQQIFNWAYSVGDQVGRLREEKKRIPTALAIKHSLADRLVLSKVRDQLGGNVRAMFSAAAPIDVETIRFFRAFGLNLVEAYGLSETSGASHTNLPEDFKIGWVGKPIPGLEQKIAEDGEICLRGPSVFNGYMNRPDETAEAIDSEGWFHTGDIGEIDDQGFLQITDRKKNLLITAGGKNVAPAGVEMLVKREPCISQVVVLGDRMPYLVALVTVDQDVISSEGISGEDVEKRVEVAINEANEQVARYEQIKKFRILDRDFSIEGGELTPTMKIKRKAVMENFKSYVDDMYSEAKEAVAQ